MAGALITALVMVGAAGGPRGCSRTGSDGERRAGKLAVDAGTEEGQNRVAASSDGGLPAAPAAPVNGPALDPPAEGAPCDFANDGVRIGESPPLRESPLRVIDPGAAPRRVLTRGSSLAAPQRWAFTLDFGSRVEGEVLSQPWSEIPVTYHLEISSRGRFHHRYAVVGFEVGDPSFGDDLPAAGKTRAQRVAAARDASRAEAAAYRNRYFEIFTDPRGAGSNADTRGDRPGAPLFGYFMSSTMALPEVPVGVGARWESSGTGMMNGTGTSTYRQDRDGVAVVEAVFTGRTPRMRQDVGGEVSDSWTRIERTEVLFIDPRTPITAFRARQKVTATIADCHRGRIRLHTAFMQSTFDLSRERR